MHVLMTNFHGNPNVGLYGFANDKYCLLGKEVSHHQAQEIAKVLKVPVHQIAIAGTGLIGAFLAGNNKMLLVPSIAFHHELDALDKLDIEYTVIKTRLTALGNNLLCNDTGCLANPEFSADIKKEIRQALGVSLKPGMIAGLDTVGSAGVLNKHGAVLHRDITGPEMDYVQDLLQVPCETGTVNMANPMMRSGVIANSKGFVVGDASGGPEVNNIDHALGFLPK
jgi:translation initiation factor 6